MRERHDQAGWGLPTYADSGVRRTRLYVLAVAMSLLALAGVVAVMTGHFGAVPVRLAQLAGATVIYTLIASGPARLLGGASEPLGIAGLWAAMLGLAAALFAIWIDDGLLLQRLNLVLVVVALSLCHAAAIAARYGAGPGTWTAAGRQLAYAAIGLIASVIVTETVTVAAGASPSHAFWRRLAALALIDALVTALLPMAVRIDAADAMR